MKTVVIHQPDFAPYLGFFHRFLKADLYIALDHVQFVKGSRAWTHRDKIKTPNGSKWVTLGLQKVQFGTPINNIKLADSSWREENLKLLEQNYRMAPFFDEIMSKMRKLYAGTHTSMSLFNLESIKLLTEMFDIKIPSVLSSTLAPCGSKNELLVDLLQKVGATHYISGVGARAYFDPIPFAKAGIDVVWQDFNHPEYPQLHGPFEPFLSSLDLLFNCGLDCSRLILREI